VRDDNVTFPQILAQLAGGVSYTILVTVACCATAMVVGLAVAAARRVFPCRALSHSLDVFVYVFRSVPVLVLLFLVYFGLPGTGLRVSPLVAMMLSLGVIAGAYLAEVFRGALDGIDASEIMAAQAMGMSRWRIFLSIELPQMLRFSVPGMVNEFTNVLKYSPFAYTVGIPEITKRALALSSSTLRGVEIYLAAGILYFLVYRFLLIGVRVLEKRYRVPGIGPMPLSTGQAGS
jgi:polar amino acid transport system permease protein